MTLPQHIADLTAGGDLTGAIAALDTLLDQHPADPDLLFARGKLHWRLGHMRQAVTDYSAAVDADPSHPARLALEQARSILAFHHTDLYNP